MHTVRPVINRWPLEVIYQGTIEQDARTDVPYGIIVVDNVPLTGATSLIKPGMFYTVTTTLDSIASVPEGTMVTSGVIRTNATLTGIPVEGKAYSDPGIATRIILPLTAGSIITVYNFYPVWTLLPRIVNGVFTKLFDIPYNGETSDPFPVANIGPWRQAWVDRKTNLATLTLSATNSIAWGAKTISSYNWTLPGTWNYVDGNSSSDTIIVTAPAGFYLIECEVTDSNAKTQSAIRPVWINDDTKNAPYSDRHAFEITSDSQDRKGRIVTVRFYGDYDKDEWIEGSAIHLSEEAYFDGQQVTNEASLINNFVGYAMNVTLFNDVVTGERGVQVEFGGPWAWFERMPMVSQAIVETPAPADWTDILTGFGIPSYIVWYLIFLHTTYYRLFDYFIMRDFASGIVEPRKLNWGLNGSTFSEYLNQVANLFGGNVGCKSSGTLILRRNPTIESETNVIDLRDTGGNVWNWTVNEESSGGVIDIIEPLEYPTTYHNTIGQLRLFTLQYNGTEITAFGSIAPGFIQMQAPGSQDEESFIIRQPNAGEENADGQAQTNKYAGMLLAKENSPTKEIAIVANRNIDVTDPADMQWHLLNIPANWDPRGNGYTNLRWLPSTVDRAWEQNEGTGWTKTITVSGEPETFGQPGIRLPIETNVGDTNPVFPDLPDFNEDDFNILWAISESGDLARTNDAVWWFDMRGGLDGEKFQDFDIDYFSPYINNGYTDGNCGGWCATIDEFDTTLKIYYSNEVLVGNVGWEQQYSVTSPGQLTNSVTLKTSKTVPNFAACSYANSNGVFCAITTDGVNWAPYTVGLTSTGLGSGYTDLEIVDDIVYISGFDGSNFRMYESQNGDPFTTMPSSPTSSEIWRSVGYSTTTDFLYATAVLREISSRSYTYTYNIATNGVGATGGSGTGSIPATPQALGSPGETTIAWSQTCAPSYSWNGPGSSGAEFPSNEDITLTFGFQGEAFIQSVNLNILAQWVWEDAPSRCTNVFALGGLFNTECRFELLFYDDSGGIIDSRTWTQTYDPDGQGVTTTIVTPNLEVESVSYIELRFITVADETTRIYPQLSGDITITTPSAITEEPTIYRQSGSNWVDITPTVDGRRYISRTQYALRPDEFDGNFVEAVVFDSYFPQLTYLALRDEDAADWTIVNDNLFHYGVQPIGDIILRWGFNFIILSTDTGENYESQNGQWEQQIGTLGTVRKALIL